MAIYDVDEMWSKQTGATASENGQKFTAQFAAAYQVTHDVDTKRSEILNHADIPQEGDRFTEQGESLPGVFCKGRQVEKVGPIFSIVHVEYSGEYSAGQLNDDPLNAPPKIVRGNRLVNVPIDTDFNGVPLTNSVGDPVTGITTDISDFTISITRNFASINQYAIRQYLRSHNSDWFDDWPPGTARFRSYTAEEVRDKFRTYHIVNAVIEFHEPYNTVPARAWYARYRNEGMRERIGVSVTFSGDGEGAAGYAITNSDGEVTKVVVTNGGRGYSAAPTVTIDSADGSGASATAVLAEDRVDSVTVDNAGSDYRSKLVNIVDDNKQQITTPALLAADGSRLKDTNQAVWIERPLSGALPYSVLGLL